MVNNSDLPLLRGYKRRKVIYWVCRRWLSHWRKRMFKAKCLYPIHRAQEDDWLCGRGDPLEQPKFCRECSKRSECRPYRRKKWTGGHIEYMQVLRGRNSSSDFWLLELRTLPDVPTHKGADAAPKTNPTLRPEFQREADEWFAEVSDTPPGEPPSIRDVYLAEAIEAEMLRAEEQKEQTQ